MYQVVKTVEEGKVFFTTVPTIWIKDNILFFPSSDWKTLRKKNAYPEQGWIKMTCAPRKEIFEKLEDGLEAEKKLVEFEDTEEEET